MGVHTRRAMCLLLPGLLPVAAEPTFARDNFLPSGAFQFDKAPMHVANNNAQIRLMMRGKLATGDGLEVHEFTLPSVARTATTHHHPHSEMCLRREGIIELAVNGKSYRLEPGSVGFGSGLFGQEHGIRNVGTAPALYFVIAVGPGAELQE